MIVKPILLGTVYAPNLLNLFILRHLKFGLTYILHIKFCTDFIIYKIVSTKSLIKKSNKKGVIDYVFPSPSVET